MFLLRLPSEYDVSHHIFGDKSHFDLHGSLSKITICFTLSCFNKKSRNKVQFWKPIAYISNISHGKFGKSNYRESIIDEHRCISIALNSIVRINNQGDIATKVKGIVVICKTWIHYIIEDTSKKNGGYVIITEVGSIPAHTVVENVPTRIWKAQTQCMCTSLWDM